MRLLCWLRTLYRTVFSMSPLVIQVGDHAEILWVDGHDWEEQADRTLRCRRCGGTE